MNIHIRAIHVWDQKDFSQTWIGLYMDKIHCPCLYMNANPPETFVKSYWNEFLKVIFYQKMNFHMIFVHSYLSYVTLFFIIKLFRLDWRNFIQVWWATLTSKFAVLFILKICTSFSSSQLTQSTQLIYLCIFKYFMWIKSPSSLK